MKTLRLLIMVLAAAIGLRCAAANDEDPVIALDDAITYGKLPCGLTYYIFHCDRPAYEVDFYLIENVGSVVESDSQRGMAHFTEHLAFSGTKHYPGRSMVSTLERHGLSFGYDINAYTTPDNTVYRITSVDVSESDEMIDTCLLMIKDIACGLSLTDEAIEAERNIIIEEWRQGNDAYERLFDRMLPALFGAESPYATRLPIGDPGVISTFKPEGLREFYRTWYQPQHQAVVVVGYVDPSEVERKLRRLWRDVKAPKSPSVREWVQVPDHEGINASVITEAEFPGCQIDLWFKLWIPPRNRRDRLSYFRDSCLGLMSKIILAHRLADISDEPDAPWSGASADYDQYYMADSKDAFRLYALYDRNKRSDALSRLILEAKRAALYGITPAEFEMTKNILRGVSSSLESQYSEKNNEEHFERISEHFIKGNMVPSAADNRSMLDNFIESVSADDVSEFLRLNVKPDNLTAVMVEKAGKDISRPTSPEFKAELQRLWAGLTPEPPVNDSEYMRPLLSRTPQPGRVVSCMTDSVFGAHKLTLSNGAEVIICRSSVLSDKVNLRAVRRGGQSVMLDSVFVDGFYAPVLADQSGLGDFSAKDLRKKLSGIQAEIEINHTAYAEMIEGESRISELETLMQMLHLRMLGVREDTVMFDNWRKAKIGSFHDLADDPTTVFNDSIRSALYGKNHPYLRRVRIEDMDTLDYAHSMRLMRWRLANPAQYTYIITGDFRPDSIYPLVEMYIGSLPTIQDEKRDEHHVVPRLALDGERSIRFSREMPSPVTKVYFAYEIHTPYSVTDEMTLAVLQGIIEKIYMQQLRTEAQGTYMATVGGTSSELDGFHSLTVTFDTNPVMAGVLCSKAKQIIREIAENGPDPDLFATVRDYQLQLEYMSTLQQEYPMQFFTHYALYGDNHRADRVPAVAFVTADDVRALASKFVNGPVKVTVIMDGVEPSR